MSHLSTAEPRHSDGSGAAVPQAKPGGPRHAATDPTPTGGSAPFTTQQILTLVAMCVGTMVSFLQVTASVSSLGSIQRALQVSPARLVWVPSAYTLMVASLAMSAGTFGNLFGRKRMFCIGAVVLAAGGAVIVSSNSVGLIIAGQLVAGVGGALLLPNSLAILAASFPDPHRRTEVITLWAASSGIGLAAGPIIAGVLLAHFSYNAAFVPAIALSVIALLITLRPVGESRQPGTRLDPFGLVLGTLTTAALVYGTIEGGQHGWTSTLPILSWIVAALALAGFVVVELRSRQPMLDVRLFLNRSFAAISVVATVSLFGFVGLSLVEVLFYEKVQSLSALATGWRLLCMFAAYVALAAVTGKLVRRTGFRLPLAGGLVLGAVGALGLLTQDPSTGFAAAWYWLALFGAGVGLVAAPSTAAAMVSVPHERTGMASGSVNAARQLGGVLGSAILGSLLISRFTSNLPRQLADHHVPLAARAGVERIAASGAAVGHAPASVTAAVGDAFTTGVHTALVVIAIVFVLSAVLTVLAVHNRPHT